MSHSVVSYGAGNSQKSSCLGFPKLGLQIRAITPGYLFLLLLFLYNQYYSSRILRNQVMSFSGIWASCDWGRLQLAISHWWFCLKIYGKIPCRERPFVAWDWRLWVGWRPGAERRPRTTGAGSQSGLGRRAARGDAVRRGWGQGGQASGDGRWRTEGCTGEPRGAGPRPGCAVPSQRSSPPGSRCRNLYQNVSTRPGSVPPAAAASLSGASSTSASHRPGSCSASAAAPAAVPAGLRRTAPRGSQRPSSGRDPASSSSGRAPATAGGTTTPKRNSMAGARARPVLGVSVNGCASPLAARTRAVPRVCGRVTRSQL